MKAAELIAELDAVEARVAEHRKPVDEINALKAKVQSLDHLSQTAHDDAVAQKAVLDHSDASDALRLAEKMRPRKAARLEEARNEAGATYNSVRGRIARHFNDLTQEALTLVRAIGNALLADLPKPKTTWDDHLLRQINLAANGVETVAGYSRPAWEAWQIHQAVKESTGSPRFFLDSFDQQTERIQAELAKLRSAAEILGVDCGKGSGEEMESPPAAEAVASARPRKRALAESSLG